MAQTPLEVVKVEMSTCDSHVDFRRVQPRIIKRGFDSTNIYSLTIGTTAGCGGIYDVGAELIRDTIFLNYSDGVLVTDSLTNSEILSEVEEVFCTCCFKFRFDIAGLVNKPCFVKVNGKFYNYCPQKYKVESFMFKVIDGDTINRIDENGLKQGFWDTLYSDSFERLVPNSFKFYAIYKDDKPIVAQVQSFYKNGKLKEVAKFKVYKHIGTVSFKKSGRKIRLK